jgi:hypothetical protein
MRSIRVSIEATETSLAGIGGVITILVVVIYLVRAFAPYTF